MGVKTNNNQVFLPEKLKEARESRGLTIRELSKQIGLITHQALSKYENGKGVPPAEVLLSIMNILKVPYDYFVEESIFQSKEEIVFFRSKANTTAKLKRIHEIKISWLMNIYYYLEQIIDFPKPNLPTPKNSHHDFFRPTNFKEIEEVASFVRKTWNLNNGPITDITHLFEKNGIVVSIVKSEDITIDACSKWIGDKLFILIGNEKASPSRIKFTLAHELGHYLLHQNVKKEDFNKSDVYKRMEEEANRFASSFLLPADTFSNELMAHSLDYFLLLKKRWQVSIQAMIYRAKDLNIINENQVSYLWKQLAKKGWRTKEPLDTELKNETAFLLKEAIDLIVNHAVKGKKQLSEEIKLSSLDIELLANLPEGYFSEQKTSAKILSFKTK